MSLVLTMVTVAQIKLWIKMIIRAWNVTMTPILPRSYIKYDSEGEVYVGLVLQ